MNPIPSAPFEVARLPRIIFGRGELARLPALMAEIGGRALLVTGATAFRRSPAWNALSGSLSALGIDYQMVTISGEPSPARIDEVVAQFTAEPINQVVGIGGGSVIDAAKAIAALLPGGESVMEYLEDVGRGTPYTDTPLTFIAVPTTAGTGSEATKNAVLSEQGETGFKKSFRHDSMVADIALVDPALLESAPPALIAAQGMDAFTQLLESYVSIRATPFTDALAWSGIEAVANGFLDAWQGGESAAAADGRAAMAYGALLSGITLAQVGLGSVHGLAQPFGSLFPIPHGIACGATVAAATAINVAALRVRHPESEALTKYARVGRLLSGNNGLNTSAAADALVEQLEAWREKMAIPRLGSCGISEADIPRIVAASRGNSMKSNPVELSDDDIAAIVRRSL